MPEPTTYEQIKADAQTMLFLVNNQLDFMQLPGDDIANTHFEKFDALEIFGELIQTNRIHLKSKQIHFRVFNYLHSLSDPNHSEIENLFDESWRTEAIGMTLPCLEGDLRRLRQVFTCLCKYVSKSIDQQEIQIGASYNFIEEVLVVYLRS